MDTLKKIIENKYLTFASTEKSIRSIRRIRKVLEKYAKLWEEIKYHIQTINADKSCEFEKNYTEIKFNSDYDLPLNKILKLHNLTIIVRSVFEEDGKEGIDINKASASKECEICHYWYFLDKSIKNESYLCNDCHDLMQKAMNFNDVAIVSIKGNDYRIHFWYMSKDDAIGIMNNSSLNEKTRSLNFFFHYI